jgi:hypothetical protein
VYKMLHVVILKDGNTLARAYHRMLRRSNIDAILPAAAAAAAVAGVMFISAVSAAKFRAARNGCTQFHHAGSWSSQVNGQVQCINFCANKRDAKAARLCGITTAAHDVDHPWPGWVYQEAWRFFNSQVSKRGQLQQGFGGGGGSGGTRGGRQQVVRWPAPYSP